MMLKRSEPRSNFPLLVRCVVERKDDFWQAFSLEFGLAAQAESKEAAKRKLEMMLRSYLVDVLVGPDKEHAEELLERRAAPAVYAKYYFGKALAQLRRDSKKVGSQHCAYRETVPLVPVGCAA